jgi:hypothetical protein
MMKHVQDSTVCTPDLHDAHDKCCQQAGTTTRPPVILVLDCPLYQHLCPRWVSLLLYYGPVVSARIPEGCRRIGRLCIAALIAPVIS